MTELDSTDQRLLMYLQQNGAATAQELGAALHLSPSQAGRRRQRLQDEGLIAGYSARVDPARVGLGVEAFISVHMAGHAPQVGRAFVALTRQRPEIVAAWTMTGEADYMLHVFCADLGALNHLVHHVLLAEPGVARVHSQIAMDRVKANAPLPVGGQTG